MPQNKEVHRAYMKDYRNKVKGVPGLGGTSDPERVTYPAVLLALTDPERRKKLEKIYHSLDHRGLAGEVRYGIEGPTFDIVGKMLELT